MSACRKLPVSFPSDYDIQKDSTLHLVLRTGDVTIPTLSTAGLAFIATGLGLMFILERRRKALSAAQTC